MDLLCYAVPEYPERATLLARLEADAPVERFLACGTMEDLVANLLRPLGKVLAVVFFPTDDVDLARILSAQDVLVSTRIIFILPDWDPELVTAAHLLRPRFMTTREMSFREVGSVLRKLANKTAFPSYCHCEKERENMTPIGSETHNIVHRATHREGKFLTFSLAGEDFGVGILKVKEIIGMMPITTIPQAPPSVKGVINLRGRVIPVIDMRLQFGMEATEYTERTCIVVVELATASATIPTGIVVDSVSEVVNIKGEDIADVPHFGLCVKTEFILGMAKLQGSVKVLLDIDRVFGTGEIAQLENAA
jgi:purine-binding chemotaxis protein CheW